MFYVLNLQNPVLLFRMRSLESIPFYPLIQISSRVPNVIFANIIRLALRGPSIENASTDLPYLIADASDLATPFIFSHDIGGSEKRILVDVNIDQYQGKLAEWSLTELYVKGTSNFPYFQKKTNFRDERKAEHAIDYGRRKNECLCFTCWT